MVGSEVNWKVPLLKGWLLVSSSELLEVAGSVLPDMWHWQKKPKIWIILCEICNTQIKACFN